MSYLNLNVHGLKRYQDDIEALWVSVYVPPLDDQTPEQVRSMFPVLLKQAEYPGFLSVARLNESGKLIGLATGWTMNEGLRQRLAGSLGADSLWLEDVFYFSGLAVLPEHQGRGVAKDLMGSLFSQSTHSRALLVTYVEEARAVQIYSKNKWKNLSMNYKALNNKFYRVMGLELGR